MSSTERPWNNDLMLWKSSYSARGSRAAVGSSRMTNGASRKNAGVTEEHVGVVDGAHNVASRLRVVNELVVPKHRGPTLSHGGAGARSMMGEWLEEPVVLELSEEQRSEMLEETGISMATITATRASFIGMAIAAEATTSAGRCRSGARVRLDLTENQRQRLSQELRTPVACLLLRLGGDVGYHESWTKDFPAFYLGDRLWVTRHGGGEEPPRPAAVVRLLADDQGEGVFGTGRHPATEIAARLLEEWIPPGGYVADIGAGSGILTIAALRLGAARVLAVDVNEASVERTRQNVAINDVSDRVVVAHREIDPAVDGPFDLVVANLLPDVLLRIAPTFAGVVRPSGTLLISGVVRRRVDEVATAIEAQGFRSLQERSNGMWAGRALRRL